MQVPCYKKIKIILWFFNNAPLTIRQVHDLLMSAGYDRKRNDKYAAWEWYMIHGTYVRKLCVMLFRFGFIEKIKRVKLNKVGIHPWLFAIIAQGRDWLNKQNDINTLHKKRA